MKKHLIYFSTISTIFLALFAGAGIASAANECDNWQATHPEWLLCDDFESGNFSKWDFVWRDGQNPAETNEYGLDGQCITNGGEQRGVCSPSIITHSGNKSFQDHYAMTALEQASDDNNHTLSFYPNNTKHFFIRGYLYIPTDIQWCGQNYTGNSGGLQRKLIYFKSTNWANEYPNGWGTAIGSFSTTLWNGTSFDCGNSLYLRFGYGGAGASGATIEMQNQTLQAGQWYSLETEIFLSDVYGQDIFRLWIDGMKVADQQIAIRSQNNINNNTGLGTIELGRQVNRYYNNPFDEYRYWDDIVISTSYIGPISVTDTTPPSAPTGLTVN